MKVRLFILLFCLCYLLPAAAQKLEFGIGDDGHPYDEETVRREIDSQPSFGLYKDTYFTGGTTIGSKPTSTNSDVKFQISVRQRLTNSQLPFHTYLFLFYTQKSFWNVFEDSFPMHDHNFNPGIGLTKIFISKGRMLGQASFLLEHESNGRDGDESRSWNKISLNSSLFVNSTLMIHGKAFIPFVSSSNKDLLRYSGFMQAGLQKMASDKRWVFDVTFVKRKGWNLNFNTIVQFGLHVNKDANQYLFVQYYNGYGECLLDYNRFSSRLRIGLLIRPTFFSEF